MIRFACPGCNSVLQTGDEKAGWIVVCPGCGRQVVVPDPAQALQGTLLPEEPLQPPPVRLVAGPPPAAPPWEGRADDSIIDEEYPVVYRPSSSLPLLAGGLVLALLAVVVILIAFVASRPRPAQAAKKGLAPPMPGREDNEARPQMPEFRDNTDLMFQGAGLFGGMALGWSCVTCGLLVPYFSSVVLLLIWVAKDARNRGIDPALWFIVMLLAGWLGLLVYLVVRPPGTLIGCQRCGGKHLQFAKVCPHCSTT